MIVGRDGEADTIKRAVGVAECEAVIVVVGAGDVSDTIKRGPDVGDM